MRTRKKPWARPALEACDFFVENPQNYIGKWHSIFPNQSEIWLELGCGKGGFISKIASSHPDINFIGIDIKDEMLILAKEKIEKEYSISNLDTKNIKIMAFEIMIIHKIMNECDSVNKIFINFCNPWYKNTHRARRLTHPNQLRQYKTFLSLGGEIWFKTDNLQLFKDSIKYFEQSGFSINYLTYDLHSSDFDENIETEHEKMYSKEGHKIMFLIAKHIDSSGAFHIQ
ncbi:tRNA (guanosine(46)-N7)-methyltransferase TrmB [Herbivorax sp. ANBcel31]|uniref:tRNA (guanosine(46)-N7)-methyltransferase TrmB n=1 Tax=Herbivorax sp. ANBcel31 TaxID=3069754 RepID=UPI0027B28166|nr:tRNA (guanosine(46)-N7)-methyltransferase TrmB [Herbivorax sp. ANBcel31]MDQ2085234.1 tRNA (guanosine(46)-N7)-methyltransferase TrmB [Herbivorax sp. ANBcel31]